ncbi:MAG: FecR family protein [Phenylobacterium sp.]
MSEQIPIAGMDTVADQAATWFARLQGEDANGDDWLAFESWLAVPAHAAAYERLEALWVSLDDDAAAVQAALDAPPAFMPRRPLPRRADERHPTRRAWLAAGGALAASLVAGVFVVANWPTPAVPTQAFRTAAGEVRDIALADGTRIKLNGASSLNVRLGRDARRVQMADAEATFDVAHDPKRPFLIEVGDQQVRVVGTEFNIDHYDGQTALTVRRGVVEVRPVDQPTATPTRLVVGQELRHRDGEAGSTVSATDPGIAFAWTQGQLIYRDAPLSQVAADLSRRLPRPVRPADPATGAMRFTGVLMIDNEDAMLRRLEAYAPVKAEPVRGAIVLRRR